MKLLVKIFACQLIYSKNWENYQNEGLKQFKEGQFDEAIESFDNSINLDPTKLDTYIAKGNVQFELKDYTQSIEIQKESNKINPNQNAFISIGKVYEKLNQNEEAVESQKSAILLRPNYPQAQQMIGSVQKSMNKINEQNEQFNKAIEARPFQTEDWLQKGQILLTFGRLTESLDAFDRVIKAQMFLYDAQIGRALVLIQMNKQKEGIESIDEAITIKENFESIYIKSLAQKQMRSLEEALDWIDKAISLDNKKENGYKLKAEILYLLDIYSQSIVNQEKSLEINPNLPESQYGIGMNRKKMGEEENSQQSFLKVLPLKYTTTTIEGLIGIGDANQEMMRYHCAQFFYHKAIKISHFNPLAWQKIGKAQHLIKKYKEAEDALKQAIDQYYESSDLYYELGKVYYDQGKQQDAIASYKKAIKINALDPNIWYDKGQAYLKVKSSEKAIKSFNSAINLSPSQTDALLQKGDYERSLTMLSLAIKQNRWLEEAQQQRCLIQEYQEKTGEAVKQCEYATLFNTKNPEYYFVYGNILTNLKEYSSAIVQQDKALKISNEQIDALLGKANAQKESNLLSEALETQDQIIAINNDPRALQQRGIVLLKKGKYSDANKDLIKSVINYEFKVNK